MGEEGRERGRHGKSPRPTDQRRQTDRALFKGKLESLPSSLLPPTAIFHEKSVAKPPTTAAINGVGSPLRPFASIARCPSGDKRAGSRPGGASFVRRSVSLPLQFASHRSDGGDGGDGGDGVPFSRGDVSGIL